MPTKRVEETTDVIEVNQGRITVNVVGTSPLIIQRLSEKARRELLLPAGRKSAAEKASSMKHDPIAEYQASPYMLDDGPTLLALTSTTFKAAMGTAALDLPGPTKAKIGRLVYVENDYVPIHGIPKLFMAVVRSADMNRTPDIRTRTIVPEWACKLDIAFVDPVIKANSIYRLLVAAGITAGVGDWRPQKGKGAYGRFTLTEPGDENWERFERIIKDGGRIPQQVAMANPEAYDSETEELLSWYVDTAKERGFKPTEAVV